MPVEVRIAGADYATLRQEAEKVKTSCAPLHTLSAFRDDWGEERFAVKLQTDPDRANAAGITNLDVRLLRRPDQRRTVTVLREGDKQIPVVTRLRMEDARSWQTFKTCTFIPHRDRRRAARCGRSHRWTTRCRPRRFAAAINFARITVGCMPKAGHLPSEVMNAIRPQLTAFAQQLPPGYQMQIGGSEEEQVKFQESGRRPVDFR